MMIRFALLALTFAALASPAQSRDGWQEHPVCDAALLGNGALLQNCQAWIAKTVQHDTRISCCGEGDAFIVDRHFTGPDGNFYVVVQGKAFLVPPNKINDAQTDGGPNQTGQEVVFILQGTGEAVCFYGAAGT